jgi:serine/threonine-protein kinase
MQAIEINGQLNEYMILEMLGSGATGDVYKCVSRSTGQVVAIKWLHRIDMAKRFEHEARTLRQINHPNIAQFIDYVYSREKAFIVMEFVEGLTIEKLINRTGKLPEAYALKVLNQLAVVIKYLHSQNIIHRDLKAANIKIMQDSTVKILDFGIAKTDFSAQLTMEGHILGSMPYMAPEQFQQITSTKVDMWALGVLYYQMLTRYLPFSGSSDLAIRTAVEKGKYISPDIFEATLTDYSKSVIKNLLKTNPNQRWNIDKLIQHLANETKSAGKTGIFKKIKSWVASN